MPKLLQCLLEISCIGVLLSEHVKCSPLTSPYAQDPLAVSIYWSSPFFWSQFLLSSFSSFLNSPLSYISLTPIELHEERKLEIARPERAHHYLLQISGQVRRKPWNQVLQISGLLRTNLRFCGEWHSRQRFFVACFRVLLMTKSWNSRPKYLRIGPRFQGFLLNWSESCSTTNFRSPENEFNRNGPKVVLAGKLCTFTSYLPPEST